MSLSTLFSLIYSALTVNFSVFGITTNLLQFWIFSWIVGAVGFVLHYLLGGDS